MDSDAETNLSLKLKQLCEPHGKQWIEKSPKESAKIFHQLGLVYRDRCLEEKRNSLQKKISFIHSAALLNCAIVRESDKLSAIKKDLRFLCFDILKNAEAKQQNFDLVKFAEEQKREVQNWRSDVKNECEKLQHIPGHLDENALNKQEQEKVENVEFLQNSITKKYKQFMQTISQTTTSILGDAPCEFALVGMGSLARKEITPYSDFENIILMQEGVQSNSDLYNKMLEYFRWYSVIFQVILINLGETILPSVAISSLNNYTTKDGNWFFDANTKRGISFDGMMPHACKSPLGRQPTKNKPWEIELIKPVNLMAKYLTQEQDLKNGYHLADILTNTCFVDGNQDVYQMFEKAVKKVLKEENSSNKQEVIKMIKNDLQNHSTKFSISSTINTDSYNVKQFAYRSTTIFITGIAKLHNIESGSCFELVRKMKKQNLISEEFCQKLQYAVAIACEIRLKTYLKRGYQYDYVESSTAENSSDISTSLVHAVGKQSCYDYLEVACCLQYDAIARYGLDNSYMFYHPVTMLIAISAFLRMHDRIITASKFALDQKVVLSQPPISDGVMDMDIIDDPTWTESDNDALNFNCHQRGLLAKQIGAKVGKNKQSNIWLGNWYSEMQNFNKKLHNFSTSKSSSLSNQDVNCYQRKNEDVADNLHDMGKYLFHKKVYFEAQYCHTTACKILQSGDNFSKQIKEIEILFWLGVSKSRNKDYDSAHSKLLNALKRFKVLSADNQNNFFDCFVGACFREMEMCQRLMGKNEEAVKSFEEALICYHSAASQQHENIGFCLMKLGLTLLSLNKLEEAKQKFEELQAVMKCWDSSQLRKANCLYRLGCCLQNLNQFTDASQILNKAINTYTECAMDENRNDIDHAYSFGRIGRCYQVIEDWKEALTNFSHSLRVWTKLYQSNTSTEHMLALAICHKRAGQCCFKYNFYKKGIEHCKKSLELYKSLKKPGFKSVDGELCYLCGLLGKLHRQLESYAEAYKYYTESMNDTVSDKRKADIHRNRGLCQKRLKNTDAAKACANKALKLYLNMHDSGRGNKRLLRNIGLCYQILNDNTKARNYLRDYIKHVKDSDHLSLRDRTSIATVHRIIGLSYYDEKIWNWSYEYFQLSLDILYELPKSMERDHEIAWLHNKIGKHWLCCGDKSKAEHSFEKALKLSDSLSSTSRGKFLLSRSYKLLGRVLCLQKTFYKARLNFKKAIQLFCEDEFLHKSVDHIKKKAWLYKEIGLCSKKQNWFEDAHTNFKTALMYYEKIQNENSCEAEIAFITKNIALCHKSLRNYQLAKEMFQKSLNIYEKIVEKNNCKYEVAFILKNLALCHKSQCQYDDALEMFEKSLAEYKNLPENDSNKREVAFVLKSMGLCHKSLKQHDFAIEMFEKSIAVRGKEKMLLNENDNSEIAFIFRNLSECHESLAVEFYEKSREFISQFEDVDPDLVSASIARLHVL